MQVHELVAGFSSAVQGHDPMSGARGLLEELRHDLQGLGAALAYISGIGGNAAQIFYRSPSLSLLKVNFPVGRRTPPHDHGTWATILLLSGVEKNTLYRADDGAALRRVSDVLLEPGSILPMRAAAVHVAECAGDAPAVGLHVYGGDILALKRRMWDPQTLAQHPLEWGLYEKFAHAASMAKSAP